MFLTTLFWGALSLMVYTYGVFPLLVALRARLRPRPVRAADNAPRVSVIIAAYNEAAHIADRLANLRGLDYPADRLEVVVASDGSTDGTDAIAGRGAGPGVRVLALGRVGKAAALEAAVAASMGEILVFTDANSMFEPGAVRALVRPFADPAVGGVAGDQRYRKGSVVSGAGAGEAGYWSFDRWMKVQESAAGSTISATGAIYAIRRDLFHGVPVGVTDDFAVSTRVIALGRRLVFAPDAVAYEPVAASGTREFGRKVRIMTRGLRGVWLMRELLDPRRHGFYAVQLFSHKVLRRLMVFPLVAIALTSPLLWQAGWLYRLTAMGCAALVAFAAAGAALQHRSLGRAKLVSLPYYFIMVNVAALMAVSNLLRGARIERWEPQRDDSAAAA